MGINESRDENTDDLISEICNTDLGVDLAVEYIQRSHRLGLESLQDVADDRNSLGKRLKCRPIIVKFVSYRKRHEIFSAKTKLKGQTLAIVENLKRSRQRIFNVAREIVGLKNSWIQDGKYLQNAQMITEFSF